MNFQSLEFCTHTVASKFSFWSFTKESGQRFPSLYPKRLAAGIAVNGAPGSGRYYLNLWLLCCPMYCLVLNKMYFAFSKQCAKHKGEGYLCKALYIGLDELLVWLQCISTSFYEINCKCTTNSSVLTAEQCYSIMTQAFFDRKLEFFEKRGVRITQ